MERRTTDRWAALYESAAERASKGEREIKRLQERIRQLEQQVEDWKARCYRMTSGNSFSHSEADNAWGRDAATGARIMVATK